MPHSSNHRPIIVCPIDLGDIQERPTAVALELAEKLEASLHLLHVEAVPTGTLTHDQLVRLESELAEYVAGWPKKPPKLELYVSAGNPSDQIMRHAEGVGARYVVMGTHGRGGLARAIIGSVAESVIRHAPCPVVVVPLRAP